MMPWNSYFLDKSPIKTILRNEKPDIIEIGEKYSLSLMAGLLRKGIMNVAKPRPMLVHFSCERMDDNVASFISASSAAKRFSRAYIRNYIFPMFDFHLANSNYTASELLDAVSGVSVGEGSQRFRNLCWKLLRAPRMRTESRVFVNNCGVDNEIFSAARRSKGQRDRINARFGIPSNAKVLLYAGRLSPEKNIALLPEIMSELRASSDHEFHLLIAGDGPKSTWLKKEFESRCDNCVTFLGNIAERSEMADTFANCDAFVHPNPREPFGIAPLEAMASGLPLVAPRFGGLLSYANDDNSWLCEPTSSGFAQNIRSIVEDPEVTRKKVEMGLATAEGFTWEKSVDRVFAIYDSMHARFLHSRDHFDYKRPKNKGKFSSGFQIDVPSENSDLKA
jgi:glycosyltransferase involved in cell wall biosynthesis